jgi:large subunit ribosomal protein L30
MAKKNAPETSEPIGKTIRIRQVKSRISCRQEHREVLKTLGLRRIGHEVVREDTPAVRGAVAKIQYLLEIVEDRA